MRFKIFLLTISLMAGVSHPSFAIGERAHAEIAQMAVNTYLKHDVMVPGLAALFESDANLRALYSGCGFPDWGYGFGYGDAAEYSHWHPFMERYVAALQQRFPPPWDAEAQRQISFFLGVVVHNISDIPWHFNEDGHKSFLQAGYDIDGAGHGDIEFACDIFLYAERALEPSVNVDAWFPLDFLLDVFDGSGHEVPRTALEQGTARSRAMFFGGWMAGALQRETQKAKMPWVYAHYTDYYYGGLEHDAAAVAAFVRYYYARLTGRYYFQNTPEYASYVRRDGSYVPRLHISDTHLMAAQPEHNAGGEPFLEVGGSDASQRVGLVRVDLSEVVPGLPLASAQLWLYRAGMTGEATVEETILTAHRVLTPWRAGTGRSDDVTGMEGRGATEEEACWQHTGLGRWSTPGCGAPDVDYVAAPVASQLLPTLEGEGDWITLDVTDAVAYWLAHPEQNHGLALRLENSSDAVPVAQFFSSEAFKGNHDGLCGGKRVAFRPAFVLLPE